jgi:excisionase family DNA binding protein
MKSITQARTTRKPQPQAKPVTTITNEQTFSIKAAAEACHCGVATIWRAIENGKLETYRTGAKRLIMGHQLLAWLQSGGKTVSAK